MKAVVSAALMTLASGSKAEMTPVQKVVDLMEKMLEKGKQRKGGEQVQFVAHKTFCESTTIEKNRAIAESNESASKLEADIQKYAADTALLNREITGLDEDISVWSSDIKAATNVRDIEKRDHADTHKSYSETTQALQRAIDVLKEAEYDRRLKDSLMSTNGQGIKVESESNHNMDVDTSVALSRAIAVVKKAAYDHKHAEPSWAQILTKLVPNAGNHDGKQKEASWAQVMKKLLPDSAKRAIDVFLQQGEHEAEELGSIWYRLTQQDQHDAEFHSHDVIELLENISGKFIDERASLEKDEMNSDHGYTMLMQDLKAQIAQATTDRGQKSETKGKKLQAQIEASADLKDTSKAMQADQKYVSDLATTCKQTSSAFAVRQKLRADEISAIQKAINIISGAAVAGNAEKHLCTMSKKDSSFAQLTSNPVSATQGLVVKYLQAQAEKLNSPVLASVSAHVFSEPFDKVRKMLKDLSVRLIEEAHEETEHKGWCQTELSTNEQTRKEKTDQVETLRAEVDQLQASISKLTEHISDFDQAVAELDSAMAEATKLRTVDRGKNAETISDAQEAQTAVAQALTVLREHYAKASAAFVKQAEIFDEPDTGMQSEANGVLGMLEVISSDFAQLESETNAAEVSAQKDFNEFMNDSNVDKSQKSADIEHKVVKRKADSQTLTQKLKVLEESQNVLDAALAYFDKLNPSCIESGVSYEDRAGRRKMEIESLQEAIRMLNGAELA